MISKKPTPKKNKNFKLPNKPSKLILLALKDLEKAKKDGCIIDMDVWHESIGVPVNKTKKLKKVCCVCLAGAVMRRGCSDKYDAFPYHYKEYHKLNALNYFRAGNILKGAYCMNLDIDFIKSGLPDTIRIIEYSDKNHNKFVAAMTKLANRFAKVGL